MKMFLQGSRALAFIVMLGMTMSHMAHGVHIAASESSSSRANPIRRVVTMLQSMAKKIEEEGETEKDLYTKYMCYCKTSGAGLQESIAAAETKVPQVQSALEEAKSKKAQLDSDVKGHQEGRDAAFHAIEEAQALRKKESGDFSAEAAEYEANIAALKAAIEAIRKGMVGSFLQQGESVSQLKKMLVQSDALGTVERDMLASFLQSGSGYAPQSGEIVGILEQLKEEMEKSLAQIQGAEQGAAKNSEALVHAKGHELTAHVLALEEKLARTGELGVQIAEMAKDLEDTKESLEEDKQFYADLDKNCAAKTAEWEGIEKLRAEELVAIHETIKILNDDEALDLFKATLPSPSLMQMTSGSKAMTKKALGFVRAARTAASTQKPGLDLIAFALTGKKVSFEKVMKMIDELIATLAKEQQDDDHHVEYCEKQFDSSDDKKKGLEQEIKDLSLAMDEAESLLASLAEEMKAISDGIKALDKEVAETTETRKEEHEAYTSLMSSDSAAKELLGIAKNRLQKFYNPALYKPPPKRELSEEETIVTNFGGTLPPTPAPGGIANTGVMALVQLHSQSKRDGEAPPPPPESFAPYAKKAEMSNGVLKMLDMLVADLDKEMQEAEVDEKNAQAAYESFIADAKAKRASDSKSLTDKESAKAEAESELQAAKGNKKSKNSELMAVEEYIGDLHSSCDWLQKNYDLRKSARASEVDSLKSAKAVLAGADYSLVQQAAVVTSRRGLRG